jgi:glycosyl-4,4'-diaponeurosporenoate acyltransferase
MNLGAWIADVLGWPAIHLLIGSAAVRIPDQFFAHDTWLTAPRQWERDGKIYRDVFAIRKWKRLLPDGAPWIGGVAKTELFAWNHKQALRFLAETRRAEIAHWCMLGFLPLFLLWNPLWARVVIIFYASAANLPCILAQRYNRILLARFARTSSFTAALS